MYFFSSKRAKLRVSGGFFDSHKAGKSLRLVNALWLLNLFQFFFVLISPSIFGVALYNGLKNGERFSNSFDWIHYDVFKIGGQFGDVDMTIVVTTFYLLIYVLWTFYSYHVKVSHLPPSYDSSLFFFYSLSNREARFQSGCAVYLFSSVFWQSFQFTLLSLLQQWFNSRRFTGLS
jgi:hypothetical protein